MVADKFPNGLIGLIGPNPIGPNHHGSPCTLLSTPISRQKASDTTLGKFRGDGLYMRYCPLTR